MNQFRPYGSASMMLASLCLFPISAIAAPPQVDDQHIEASLVTTAIPAPGESFLLAINLNIDEDWHTYWPGINDTGYGVSYTIDPVDGLTFGDPYFPTPTRHLAPGSILDHIYEGAFQILIPVTVSSDVQSGSELTINTTTSALVCKNICIPETADASTKLLITDYPVQTNPGIVERYNNRAAPLKDDEGKITWKDESATLTIPGVTRYQFFPAADCTQPAHLIKEGDTESSTLTITFDRSYDEPGTPMRLSGRVRVLINDDWREYTIDYPQAP